jgi:FkbM family methyltransferase
MRMAERLHCIEARLAGQKQLSRIGWADVLRSAGSWYGLARRSIHSRMRTERFSNDLVWVELGPYGLAWPVATPVKRLAVPLAELWVRTNPHYYFHALTPVRAGDHVVDVGACEGSFAVECVRRFGAATVYAFEPSRSMANALRTTVHRNGLEDRLQVIEAAVADRPGVVEFVDDPANPLTSRVASSPVVSSRDGAVSSPTCRVPQVTLDEWRSANGIGRVDYLKIDAEGSDFAVLVGAGETLRQWKPAIAVTTYHEPEHGERMVDFLRSLNVGYVFHAKGVVSFGKSARPVMLHCAVPDRGAGARSS